MTSMRICTVGDNVVDRYVDRGAMYPGGNTVNVAVHVRRCGVPSAYVGALGDDDAGRLVESALVAEGVDTTRTRILPGPNAFADVRVVNGDRIFGDHSLGVSQFTLTDEDFDYLAGFDLVHTGECSHLEGQLAAMADVGPVSFDFSIRPRPYAEPLLPYVTIATFSASWADDDDVDRLVDWAHRLGPRHVLVTRGAAGATISDGRRRASHPALPVGVIDTLGAGDAFIARACVALLSGATPDEAVEAAVEYAASTCQSFGAFGYEAPIARSVAAHMSVSDEILPSPHS